MRFYSGKTVAKIGGLGALVITATAFWLEAVSFSPESKLWLVGDSTLHAYHSSATKIDASVEFDPAISNDSLIQRLEKGQLKKLVVVVPVVEMKSGKNQLDSNMQKSLDAKNHPSIRFEMKKYETNLATAAPNAVTIRAFGTLEVAGKANDVEIDATATAAASGVRIEGQKPLLMTDFGVKPPNLLLIKTRNEVQVHFDVILDPSGEAK